MSCVNNAPSISGPVVGRLSTTDTMAAPEINSGSTPPMLLTNGLMAMRTGTWRSA